MEALWKASLSCAMGAHPYLGRGSSLHAGLETRDSKASSVVGRLFSTVRDRFADHFIDAERSYRGTLLGMRHGIDLVRLLAAAARAAGDAELADYCNEWLQTRTRLIADVEAQLDWLGEHADRGRVRPKSGRRLQRLSQRAPS